MKAQINRIIFILLLLIVFSTNIHSNDRGFFPFGFYDEIQGKGGLSLGLNYGFLDHQDFYPHFDGSKWTISRDNVSLGISYGLSSFLTLTLEGFAYRKIIYVYYSQSIENDGEICGSRAYDLNLNIIVSWTKRLYSTIRFFPNLSYPDEKANLDRKLYNFNLQDNGVNLGYMVYDSMWLSILSEINLSFIIGGTYHFMIGVNLKPSPKISINFNYEYIIQPIVEPESFAFFDLSIYLKLVNNVILAPGFKYIYTNRYWSRGKIQHGLFSVCLKWSPK